MYMTLEELIKKLNVVPKYYGVKSGGEVITDAWVAKANDPDYPEGTVLFQCRSCNIKAIMTKEDNHILSIYPNKATRLN